jgi:hypothetical protein
MVCADVKQPEYTNPCGNNGNRQMIKRGLPHEGEKMAVERRKFKRHGAPESGYFVFDHDTSEMARIKDVSLGGLKFEYLSLANAIIEWRLIDIFGIKGSRFHLFGIPCKQIYSIAELSENKTFSGSRSRTSGLKFIHLTGDQQTKLESLINQLSAVNGCNPQWVSNLE